MSDVPKSVRFIEVGPRDGLQIEKQVLPTDQKLELIKSLVAAGVGEIEVTSFVNPSAVPQMADAAEVAQGLPDAPGVTYKALFLNPRGLERALECHRITVTGDLFVSASDTFSRRNMNRSTEEIIGTIPRWVELYQSNGIVPDSLSVMAAFGCNFEGDILPDQVVAVIGRVDRELSRLGCSLQRLALADTMGWAVPETVKRVVGQVRGKWPGLDIKLHLHDTRGMAVANAMAGLDLGISCFEGSVGGLGGCPFAGNLGAAGNICSEDFLFLCQELGIETGVDLEKLIDAAQKVEGMLGHSLPGKLMRSRPPVLAGASRFSPGRVMPNRT